MLKKTKCDFLGEFGLFHLPTHTLNIEGFNGQNEESRLVFFRKFVLLTNSSSTPTHSAEKTHHGLIFLKSRYVWASTKASSGACLGHHLGNHLGHHLGHACLGHQLGYHLGMSGACLEYVWDMSGASSGAFLGLVWGLSRSCLGHVWGMSGASSGSCLRHHLGQSNVLLRFTCHNPQRF